jgi:hypothetical protein
MDRGTIKGSKKADFLAHKSGGKDISEWVKASAYCVKTEKMRHNSG